MKRVVAIRGAVCTENTEEAITKNVCEMCNKIFSQNHLHEYDLISIIFSVTKDINILNPATALRKGKTVLDISETPLFCTQEPDILNSMPCVIRVIIYAYKYRFSQKHNVYLNGAEKLRPDYENLDC